MALLEGSGEGGAPSQRASPGWKPGDLWRVAKLTGVRWSEDKAPKMAAALAYYTSFATAPVLVVAIAIAGIVFGQEAARGRISKEIGQLVGPEAAQGIRLLLAHAWSQNTGLVATAIGGIAVLFGATGVFAELQDSLNSIWRVRKKPGRGFRGIIRDRILSFGLILGVGFLLLVSLVLSAALQAVGDVLDGGAPVGILTKALNAGLSFVIVAALFASLFKVLPDANTRWSHVWLGASVTALLFTGGKFLIGLYLGRGSVASAYGAAGSFAIFLLWIYYSSLIFFLGAEFTKVLSEVHGAQTPPSQEAEP